MLVDLGLATLFFSSLPDDIPHDVPHDIPHGMPYDIPHGMPHATLPYPFYPKLPIAGTMGSIGRGRRSRQ